MNFLPEWAPNLHPLIVHFPIAILILAVVFDFMSLILKNQKWLSKTTLTLFVIGALGALFAFYTGHEAASHLQIPKNMMATLEAHEEWAEYTVWYFTLFAIFRLILSWFNKNRISPTSVIAFLLGFVGLFLLYKTGQNGGKLVYKYNLGTEAYRKEISTPIKLPKVSETEVVLFDNGGWSWQPGDHASQVLKNDFTFLKGKLSNLNISKVVDGKDTVMALNPKRTNTMFVFNRPLKNEEITFQYKVKSFDGNIALVEYVKNKKNYEYLKITKDRLELGRILRGQNIVHDINNVHESGWTTIRLRTVGTNIECYFNKKRLFKLHLGVLPPGNIGLQIVGTGTVLIKHISAQSLNFN